MGGRLTRVFRTLNVESRARREISKEKPTPAPRHPTSRLDALTDNPEIQQEIYRKDDRLLALLKDVYVESRDPPAQCSRVWCPLDHSLLLILPRGSAGSQVSMKPFLLRAKGKPAYLMCAISSSKAPMFYLLSFITNKLYPSS
ncbi:NADH dehydrogenase [ubiquinone] 1 alpha subcomplex assembly factor 4 isoform X2 [Gallus gallus]|uniref:NADH dehydrogenase [ubiquinone] 1 alpha subcomplex assembly factor 4 isoform X2 n=1 Tax=Gallus gallus TaxID=9031 RepID=UPI0003506706|nr:NADH dehydrogenase [ubiquinone] 1 alpha subcomplex assembly factor 4 isoform X2 [Gallus gallus]|eukprot:XP_004940423.1 NADH dehydrogenase [ubiquinone] 1 alpha subcomplex assembly factor 4 isoform X2 [Gallus gallus]